MSRVVLLDAGPLGMVSHPRVDPVVSEWLARLLWRKTVVCIPEIADCEVRRELVRANKPRGLARLDACKTRMGYVPLTTQTMLLAADLWAQMRRSGRPAADDTALDGDVILAAQARLLAANGSEVVVATTNVKHLSTLTDARVWSAIS
jgi:toxin FitB